MLARVPLGRRTGKGGSESILSDEATMPYTCLMLGFIPYAGRDGRYWRTPLLFGAGLCLLQMLAAAVRFGGWSGDWSGDWSSASFLFAAPAMLMGLAMFFLCGVLVGLLVQRLLRNRTGAWRSVLLAGVVLATPCAVALSLLGGLLGPPGVLLGALIPYLLLVGIPVFIHKLWFRFARGRRVEESA